MKNKQALYGNNFFPKNQIWGKFWARNPAIRATITLRESGRTSTVVKFWPFCSEDKISWIFLSIFRVGSSLARQNWSQRSSLKFSVRIPGPCWFRFNRRSENFELRLLSRRAVEMDVNQATSRTRSLMAPTKSGSGLSMRTGNRMPLGEITVNGKSGQETRRPQKSQVNRHSLIRTSKSFKSHRVLPSNPHSRLPPLTSCWPHAFSTVGRKLTLEVEFESAAFWVWLVFLLFRLKLFHLIPVF